MSESVRLLLHLTPHLQRIGTHQGHLNNAKDAHMSMPLIARNV